MNLGRPLGPIARRLLAPIGWFTAALCVIPCAVLLYLSRDPSFYYLAFLFFIPMFWVLLGAVLLGRMFMRAVVCLVYRQSFRPLPGDRKRRRVVYAVAALTTLLVIFHVPLRLVFVLARPALERTLAEVRNQPNPTLAADRRAGIITLAGNGVRREGNVLLFFFRENGESAFAYCPDGPPQGQYNAGDHGHLSGPWYWVAED